MPDGVAAATSLHRARHRPRSRRLPPIAAFAGIVLAGSLVTALISLTAARLDESNEHRLLDVQTRQAAALVGAAIAGVEAPLQTAIDIATVTHGEPSAFVSYIGSHAGPQGTFAAASLWRVDGGAPQAIASVGTFSPTTTVHAQMTQIEQSRAKHTLAVGGIPAGYITRITYALVDSSGTYAIYAERPIAANRRVPVENNSAFSELNFATYLGPTTSNADIATTDVSRLPLRGHVVTETIPFGDSVITLTTTARGHLGSVFSLELWWIVIIIGSVLTLAAAAAGGRLTHLRERAESDSRTIAGLYDELDAGYGEQRSIALTLQQALLPQTNPDIPELEIGSRYVAGVDGVDVGGDWFSMIAIDDERFAFVVGDVSGRGVRAAAVMARMRFSIRAYLAEGHSPGDTLRLAARQLDRREDGHFATALVGIAVVSTREVTVASAGHLPPVVQDGADAHFLTGRVGRPLGIGGTEYPSSTHTMPAGSLLLAYTDGLVERRTEALDAGLERLRREVSRASGPIDEVISTIVTAMTGDGSEDDVAVLAFRWR